MKTNKGFSLIELMIYIAGFAVLALVISTITIQILNIYRDITVIPRTDQVAISVVDRMMKDVRSGVSVDTNNSLLGTSFGSLTLNSQENGSSITKKFGFQNGRVYYQENGGSINYITPADFEVTEMRFTRIYTGISEAIRIDLDFTYQNRGENITKEYTGLAILRKSYE